MKTKLNREKLGKIKSADRDFDILVKELQISNKNGCCSGEATCNIRCNPSNGDCGKNGDGGCC